MLRKTLIRLLDYYNLDEETPCVRTNLPFMNSVWIINNEWKIDNLDKPTP